MFHNTDMHAFTLTTCQFIFIRKCDKLIKLNQTGVSATKCFLQWGDSNPLITLIKNLCILSRELAIIALRNNTVYFSKVESDNDLRANKFMITVVYYCRDELSILYQFIFVLL